MWMWIPGCEVDEDVVDVMGVMDGYKASFDDGCWGEVGLGEFEDPYVLLTHRFSSR